MQDFVIPVLGIPQLNISVCDSVYFKMGILLSLHLLNRSLTCGITVASGAKIEEALEMSLAFTILKS
ncbi:MAG: hypothetical protein MZU84_05185 [Sphingobacterium sp.]|nr:hypothetical protein [Sphingobacterium sp.]